MKKLLKNKFFQTAFIFPVIFTCIFVPAFTSSSSSVEDVTVSEQSEEKANETFTDIGNINFAEIWNVSETQISFDFKINQTAVWDPMFNYSFEVGHAFYANYGEDNEGNEWPNAGEEITFANTYYPINSAGRALQNVNSVDMETQFNGQTMTPQVSGIPLSYEYISPGTDIIVGGQWTKGGGTYNHYYDVLMFIVTIPGIVAKQDNGPGIMPSTLMYAELQPATEGYWEIEVQYDFVQPKAMWNDQSVLIEMNVEDNYNMTYGVQSIDNTTGDVVNQGNIEIREGSNDIEDDGTSPETYHNAVSFNININSGHDYTLIVDTNHDNYFDDLVNINSMDDDTWVNVNKVGSSTYAAITNLIVLDNNVTSTELQYTWTGQNKQVIYVEVYETSKLVESASSTPSSPHYDYNTILYPVFESDTMTNPSSLNQQNITGLKENTEYTAFLRYNGDRSFESNLTQQITWTTEVSGQSDYIDNVVVNAEDTQIDVLYDWHGPMTDAQGNPINIYWGIYEYGLNPLFSTPVDSGVTVATNSTTPDHTSGQNYFESTYKALEPTSENYEGYKYTLYLSAEGSTIKYENAVAVDFNTDHADYSSFLEIVAVEPDQTGMTAWVDWQGPVPNTIQWRIYRAADDVQDPNVKPVEEGSFVANDIGTATFEAPEGSLRIDTEYVLYVTANKNFRITDDKLEFRTDKESLDDADDDLYIIDFTEFDSYVNVEYLWAGDYQAIYTWKIYEVSNLNQGQEIDGGQFEVAPGQTGSYDTTHGALSKDVEYQIFVTIDSVLDATDKSYAFVLETASAPYEPPTSKINSGTMWAIIAVSVIIMIAIIAFVII